MAAIHPGQNRSEPITASSLLARVEAWRIEANARLDDSRRGKLGQFFTPAPIAQFMGSMFETRSAADCIHVLDAGAGVGSLTAAVVARLCERVVLPPDIRVTAFEIEPRLLEYLHGTLNACGELCQEKGIDFEWTVVPDDFIVTAKTWLLDEGTFFAGRPPRYDFAIINPPYHKINSASDTRRQLRQVGIETSNLYAAFVWLAARLLKPGGEMVAITPRSFCNGPYFRPFRLAWLGMMALRRVHVFESRDSAFRGDAVLNERSALTMLALLGLRPGTPWSDATNPLLGITEIMDYLRAVFGKRYKPNTRETIRRPTVHQFVQMGLVAQNPDDPSRPVNSPHNRYQVDENTLQLFKAFGTSAWAAELPQYLAAAEPLQLLRVREREMTRIAVRLPDGRQKTLSAGGQNTLIKQIIEEFCERYTPGSYVAYLGDAEEKLNDTDRA